MKRLLSAFVFVLLFTTVTNGGPGPARASSPRIGTNLFAQSPLSSDIPFVDVFKTSAPWSAKSLAPGVPPAPLALDAEGWVVRLAPGQGAETRIFQNGRAHYPGGLYTVFYDGIGWLDISGAGVSVVDRAAGQIKVLVKPTPGPNGGITIVERDTDPANPLRRIRFVMPGFETSYLKDPFNPLFLERLKPFRAIRFMEWQRINYAQTQEWADERSPDYETQTAPSYTATDRLSGVALEYQIDLANRLGADPWFTVPVRASDDFVRHMAELVHRRLRPNLHVYLEYGNETWNQYFSANHDYVTNKGLAAGLSSDRRLANIYQYATRSSEIFRIWSGVYGPDQGRLRRVFSAVTYDPKFTETGLTFLKSQGGKADVLAIAPYVSPRTLVNWQPVDSSFYDRIVSMSVPQVLIRLDDEVDEHVKPLIERYADLARRFGLTLVAYEDGVDLNTLAMEPRQVAAYRGKIADLFTAVSRDPNMSRIFTHMFDSWFNSGGDLLMIHTFAAEPDWYGASGLLEYQDQPPETAPKYRAVMDYLGVKADQAAPAPARDRSKKRNRSKG